MSKFATAKFISARFTTKNEPLKFNLKNILETIVFYFKSTNEHGVHSPFVFDFLTKCLYQKNNKQKELIKEGNLNSKTTQAIFRILNYFKPQTICYVGHELMNQNILFENINVIKHENLEQNIKVDAIIISKAIDFEEFENFSKEIHNDSFCLMLPSSKILWNSIKNHKKVTVTIDCNHFMLVFFRKEQPKQNFLIRF